MTALSLLFFLALAPASASAESYLVQSGRIVIDHAGDADSAVPGPGATTLVAANRRVARQMPRLRAPTLRRCRLTGQTILVGVDPRTGAMIAEFRATAIRSCRDVRPGAAMARHAPKGRRPNI